MKQSRYKKREELPMFLTVTEVADLLGISRASAYELAHEEDFPKFPYAILHTTIYSNFTQSKKRTAD